MDKNSLNILDAAAGIAVFPLRSLRLDKYNVKIEYFDNCFRVAIFTLGRYPELLRHDTFSNFQDLLFWLNSERSHLNEN